MAALFASLRRRSAWAAVALFLAPRIHSLPPGPAIPQEAQEVRFAGGGVWLAGTLALPPGSGPHPAVAITHGSEPGSRHGYRFYADLFLERGLAVLRYDKRGVGGSEGVYVESPDLRQPCADLLGAVAFLRTHPSIDPECIGVFGASQGGWVAPMAAIACDKIRFVCVQSAPSVSPFEQNLYDKGNQLRALGLSEADVERATAYRRAYWGYLLSGEGFSEASRAYADVTGEGWFTPESFPFPFGRREEVLRHPRLRDWALHNAFDPRLTLERVSVPLLAVYGGTDRIVPVEDSVARLRAAFGVSGNPNLTVRVFEGGDHGLRVSAEHGTRSIAPEYRELLGEWAAQQAFSDD